MKKKKIVFSEEKFADLELDLRSLSIALSKVIGESHYLIFGLNKIITNLAIKKAGDADYEKVW
jgi:hypothetical protein